MNKEYVINTMFDYFQLEGKTAIVTGAANGIGAGIAKMLAGLGANVVACDIEDEPLAKTVDSIKAEGGSISALHCDISCPEDVENSIKTAIDTYGALHILVNNAAGCGGGKKIDDMTDPEWDRLINLNLTCVYKFIMKVYPVFKAQQYGKIVNISSGAAITGDWSDPHHIDYERNFNLNYPWAVDNLVECVAHECEPGHFVYFEKRTQAYIDTCWPEMSVVSQHTSSNAFSEGAARVAIDMCLENDRQKMTDYEREVIFDICGLDKKKAELMPLWHEFSEVMGYGKLEATRNLWDGVWTLEEAGAFLEKYCFNDLGSGADTITKAPDDIGHYCAHNYIKDVVRDFFNDVCPDFRDQFKLYENLCSDDFSMSEILDHSYRFEPYLLK